MKVGVEYYNLRSWKSEVEIDTGIIWEKTWKGNDGWLGIGIGLPV